MIWREKQAILIVLGLILVANTVFFFTYRVQYQNRLDSLEERRDTAETQLEEARTARVRAERQFASYKKVEADIEQIYNGYWSTQQERLTPMIAEVKRLAAASNMEQPRTYAFDKDEVKAITVPGRPPAAGDTPGPGTRRSKPVGAVEVGIGFTVDGTYEQARRLINLLELSRQFVIVDEVSLNSVDGQKLTLNLHVKTLFRDPSQLTRRPNQRL